MSITKAYAVLCVSDLARARSWYQKLFGKAPDLSPMPEVHEWYFGQGGVQVVDDPGRAGRGMLTLITDDLEAIRAELEQKGLALGKASGGDFARIAQIQDPDGNLITFAQPGPAQQRMHIQPDTAQAAAAPS
jgi:predicted enzyme related to lactoylglutathione lyase